MAAGEKLSDLNHGENTRLSSPGSREAEEMEGNVRREAGSVTVGLILIVVFTSFHSFSL